MHKTFLQPRRGLALCLAFLLTVTLFALPSRAAGLAGSGTAQDPYLIATQEDLAAFRDKVNGGEGGAWGKLTGDIALSGE